MSALAGDSVQPLEVAGRSRPQVSGGRALFVNARVRVWLLFHIFFLLFFFFFLLLFFLLSLVSSQKDAAHKHQRANSDIRAASLMQIRQPAHLCAHLAMDAFLSSRSRSRPRR